MTKRWHHCALCNGASRSWARVALLAALLIGVGLAGGITSPVQTLVAGMREVLKGNLHYRSKIERQDEIGFLARSFNDMVGGLAGA